MNTKTNCFDLLRHFAAFLVLYSHHFALSGLSEPVFMHWDTLGTLAVLMFFAISGFFMPTSFSSAGNFLPYMLKRCRRIFPGLLVCSVVTYYLIGGALTPESSLHYVFSLSPLKSSLLNTVFIRCSIPGVFSDFIYKNAINGSLWTLPIEFAFYITLGIFLTYSNSRKTLALLFVCFTGLSIITNFTFLGRLYYAERFHMAYIATFGMAFTMGAVMSQTHDYWVRYRKYLLFLIATSLFLFQWFPDLRILVNLSLAILTIIIGTYFREIIFDRKLDISYGIYIYAFLIQQIVINMIPINFGQGLCLATLRTCLVAYLSCRFIEHPFLRSAKTKFASQDAPSSNAKTGFA